MNKNEILPQNLQDMVKSLAMEIAVPLGEMENIPIVAVKVSNEDEKYIKDISFTSELKASILNIEFNKDIFALAFVQIRLNKDNSKVYTVVFDLQIDKQYKDCIALLNMKSYGLLIVSDNIHDVVSFSPKFEADFIPINILEGAKLKATDYSPDKLLEITHALRSQVRTNSELWNYLDKLAPFEKSWYAYMKMDKE